MSLDPKTLSRILAVLVPEKKKDWAKCVGEESQTIEFHFGKVDGWNECRYKILEDIKTKTPQILSEIEKAMEEKEKDAKRNL